MRFKRASRFHVGVDTIALTDIVMNLFLFFFITFSLVSTFNSRPHSALKVNLPTIGTGSNLKNSPAHEIRLTKSGELFWDNAKIPLDQLKPKLAAEKGKAKFISLQADREASIQNLVNVLEVIRNVGATNVSLQTELKH